MSLLIYHSQIMKIKLRTIITLNNSKLTIRCWCIGRWISRIFYVRTILTNSCSTGRCHKYTTYSKSVKYTSNIIDNFLQILNHIKLSFQNKYILKLVITLQHRCLKKIHLFHCIQHLSYRFHFDMSDLMTSKILKFINLELIIILM